MEIKRLYFNKLYQEKWDPKVSILLGPRQVGKSTLLRQLEKKIRVENQSCTFYDLEQPSDLLKVSGSEKEVMEEFTSRGSVIFIDEFHYLKNASKIFKAIYDSKKPIKIYASGSSSLEIHKHLKESLAGRYLKTMIFPLTLTEWRQTPRFQDEEFLQWGGLPGLAHEVSKEKRAALLENIVGTYITKDIKGLIQEENIRVFNSLLFFLAQAQGSVVKAASLSKETGLSEATVSRHLEIMAQTYVLHTVMSYSRNLANELKKSKKYYLFDIGIRNLLLKDFNSVQNREDKGTLYESAVLLHLLSQLKPNMEVRFWRTKKGDEIDFILLKNRIPVPIEVKSHLKEASVPKAIHIFLERYPAAPFGIVFNASLEKTVEVSKKPVYFKLWTQVEKWDYLQRVV